MELFLSTPASSRPSRPAAAAQPSAPAAATQQAEAAEAVAAAGGVSSGATLEQGPGPDHEHDCGPGPVVHVDVLDGLGRTALHCAARCNANKVTLARLTLHPARYILLPAPYTLHPTPYTLHPAPENPNPLKQGDPGLPYPAPYTLHPVP